jgi:hypothetical protein
VVFATCSSVSVEGVLCRAGSAWRRVPANGGERVLMAVFDRVGKEANVTAQERSEPTSRACAAAAAYFVGYRCLRALLGEQRARCQ